MEIKTHSRGQTLDPLIAEFLENSAERDKDSVVAHLRLLVGEHDGASVHNDGYLRPSLCVNTGGEARDAG